MRYEDSAKFWFPKIANMSLAQIRVPKTIFVDYNEDTLTESLFGKNTAEYERLYYAVEDAIREIGYPTFIRTDLTSAKHSGRLSCIVENENTLNNALLNTLYQAHLKSYHSKTKSSAIMVREFIKVKHERTAFRGLPIGNEWRVFANQTEHQCYHCYWPMEALDGKMDDGKEASPFSKGWIRSDLPETAALLAKQLGLGTWSFDFVEDVRGIWWLVDMATAGNSYHDPSCEYAKLDKPDRL
jgi:hypothetical protein